MRCVYLAIAAAWATIAVTAALGQAVTGSVSGTVYDPSGAGVDATVRALRTETGTEHLSQASADGSYRFLALSPGDYALQPVAPNLAAAAASVQIRVGTHVHVDLQMRLETEQVAIDIMESTPLIEAGTSSTGTVIDRSEMRNLPLNNRVFLPLTLLAGGSHASAPGSELSTQSDSGFHVSGSREASNNFLLDGIDNNDLYINRIVVSPPLDTVREFRLHASGYRAEYGRSAGGQVNVVTRSGTQDFHGSVYEYLRNDALDARNHFDPSDQSIPAYRRNQFGLSGGGPLGQRTFFFGGFEGTRIRDAATRTAAVPTAAQLDGDFASDGGPVIDPFARAPFPNNTVPLERQSPQGRAISAYWPGPNRADPVQNFVATPVADGLINQGSGRLDQSMGDDRFYLRYNASHTRSFDPYSDSDVPGFGSFTLDRGHQIAGSFTHAFSPSILLEARAGLNRLRRTVQHQNVGHDIAAEIGIPGLSEDPRHVGFPSINVAGFASLSDDTALPIARVSDTVHVAQSLTLVRRNHTLKWGGEIRLVAIDGAQGLFGRGQFNFLGAISQHPVADLLLGFPTFSIRTQVDNDFRQRARFWNGYVQDDWTVAPGVTLSLGVRYEYNAPAYDADDRFSQFDLASNQLVRPGETTLGRAGYSPDRNNLGPRIGIAWNLDDSLVLRVAYGVHHDSTVLEANSGLYFNPPYFDLQIFFPSAVSLPNLADPFSGGGFTPPASVNALQPDYRNGYVQRWNVGLERGLPGRVTGRASYIAAKGSKLLRRRNLNQPAPGDGPVDLRRPTPGYANIVLFESGASSTYHSGVFSLERRFARHTGFRAAYTWSKSIDDVSAFLASSGDQSFPQNSHDFRAERGLSNFDQRHRLSIAAELTSPLRHKVLSGWRTYAIAAYGSGRPLTPQLAIDNSNTGNTGGIFGSDRPHLIGTPSRPATGQFFSEAAFAMPDPFSFGNAGRNILTGPSTVSVDLAVVRALKLTEAVTAEIRWEMFNLGNRVNFGLPERTFGQPTFGRSLAAGQARQIQLGLRFSF